MGHDSKVKQVVTDFTDELTEWYRSGTVPKSAGQDVRFALDLQKQKLSVLGISADISFNSRGEISDRSNIFQRNNNIFTSVIVSRHLELDMRYSASNGKMYKKKDNIVLDEQLLKPVSGNVPQGMPLCCPYCGAAATVGQLLNGCEHCGTKFLMSELYPKVTGFFYFHDPAMGKGEGKKKILPWILIGAAVGMIFGGLLDLINGFEAMFIGYGVSFAFLGYIAWCVKTVGGLIFQVGKALPTASKAVGQDKRITAYMTPYDPGFSFNHFEAKVYSLLKMMIYCDNKSDLAVYDGQVPAPVFPVIDTMCEGMMLQGLNVSPEGMCDMSLDVFTKDIVFNNGHFIETPSTYRMNIRKSIRKPTQPGFSFKAVCCGSCGASFDAARVNHCPYCGEDFRLENEDWIVTYITRK